ncbi:MAG: nitroreductase family deazaflavin-dependent oxidoreductase [Myxococcales bacterium]|nr:nitroreductase family deazaflavin-dependent oxidoreductase [Myxococcales bacterium]
MRNRSSGRIALTLACFILAFGACAPKNHRPGLWLSGDVIEMPVSDWSFSAEYREIFVETRTWYGIPHSVTTVCASHEGKLYVPSVYSEGGAFPDARFWNRNVARDPHVRVQLGEEIYARRAVLVSEAVERAGVLEAFATKYPFWRDMLGKPEAERPTLVLLRMDPQ